MPNIEVAYALPEKQIIQAMFVADNTTVQAAIEQSGLLQQYREIDLATAKVGIFSRPTTLDTILQEGDRIEIYRPLQLDPKQQRRLKASRQKNKS